MNSLWLIVVVGVVLWMGFGQYIILKRFIDPETKISVIIVSAITMALWPLYYITLINLRNSKKEANK